jgi:hypothetical protein
MKEFAIFKSEIQDGLKEKIISSMSISSTCELEICDPFLLNKPLRAVAENKNQMDLHYLKSILVTTGWNKNDDVFDKAEVWTARNTPSDKPFNYEHDQKQIIGHITGSKVIDEDGNDVAEGVSVDELPKKFHILTSAVLYKFWEDPKKQEEMNDIISGIANNKWFVSMEALFNNFDYAMDDGVAAKVIARNEKTAFLTKHLRAYGGNGVFNNVKIGRVLKNIVFSGKGLVRKPANPESIIFDETEAFITSSVYQLDETTKSKEIIMSIEEVKAEKIVAEFPPEVPEEKKEETSEDPAIKEEDKEKEEVEANKWWEDKKKKMEEEASMYEEDKKKMMAESEAMKKQLNMVVNELNSMKKEKSMSDRASLVIEKFGMNKDEATLVVSALSTLNDESFATAVNVQSDYFNKKMSEYKSGKTVNEEAPAKDPEEDKKKNPSENVEISEDPADVKASASILDTAEVKSDAALATSESSNGVKQVASQIASYFGLETSATE